MITCSIFYSRHCDDGWRTNVLLPLMHLISNMICMWSKTICIIVFASLESRRPWVLKR
jgi:hypothetical protein